jgi:hypothetical protein
MQKAAVCDMGSIVLLGLIKCNTWLAHSRIMRMKVFHSEMCNTGAAPTTHA